MNLWFTHGIGKELWEFFICEMWMAHTLNMHEVWSTENTTKNQFVPIRFHSFRIDIESHELNLMPAKQTRYTHTQCMLRNDINDDDDNKKIGQQNINHAVTNKYKNIWREGKKFALLWTDFAVCDFLCKCAQWRYESARTGLFIIIFVVNEKEKYKKQKKRRRRRRRQKSRYTETPKNSIKSLKQFSICVLLSHSVYLCAAALPALHLVLFN